MKKIIFSVISAIIASAVCCSAMASSIGQGGVTAISAEVYDIAVKGTARPGHTLTVEYELSEQCSSEETVIKWYRDDNEIDGENDAVYALKKEDAGHNVKAGITPADEDGTKGMEMFSQSFLVAPSLTECTARNSTNIADYSENPLVKNNPEYVFSENGYTYAYLAAEENGMYVIADDVAGRVKLAEDPKDNWFNPEDSSTVAYWLNNDYLDGMVGSGGKKINPHVIDYLMEREYLTEGNGISDMAISDDYNVKCKIALPAFYEFTEEYSGIIGYNPTGASYYMTFRTPVSKNRTSCPNLKADTGAVGVSVITTANKNYTNLTLRVCMLVGYDFFKEHKLDMNMGDKVKEFLRSRFTRDEMAQAGYTDEELEQLGYSQSPVNTSGFTVSGVRAAGQMLTAENINELPENVNIEYSWYYCGEANGQFRKITSANCKDYVIEQRLTGKYIKSKIEISDSETREKYGTWESVTDKIEQTRPLTVIAESFEGSTGTFAISNNTDEQADIYFIIAAFDGDNKMIGCTAQTETAESGESKIDITVQTDNAYVYRLMAWESKETEKLLCAKTVRQ